MGCIKCPEGCKTCTERNQKLICGLECEANFTYNLETMRCKNDAVTVLQCESGKYRGFDTVSSSFTCLDCPE